MSDVTTCHACGASNPAGADWCTLCFARFDEPAPEPEPVVRPAAAEPAVDQFEPSAPGEQLSLIADDRKTWRCRYCEARVALEESACPRCQQSIYDSFGHKDDPGPDVAESVALRWALLPGAGHLRLGHGVLGVAVGFSVLLSAIFGVVMLKAGRATHGSLLILIMIGTWLASIHDALRFAKHQPDETLLRPRVLSVVAGVVFMIIVGASVSAQSAINQ